MIVHPKVKEELIKKLKHYVVKQFGEDPLTNINYSRLIHKVHAERCAKLLENNKDNVIHGDMSTIDTNSNFIPPIFIDSPNMTSALMKEEIFGPILPIITWEKTEEIIKFIKSKPRPLAIYFFGNSKSSSCKNLAERTISGAFVINETMLHVANLNLPFGGVGDSGYGVIHGKEGFMSMSHCKAYLDRPNSTFLDLENRYPSDESVDKRLKKLKKVDFVFSIDYEDVANWCKGVFGAILVVGLFVFLTKNDYLRVDVTFPRYQK